MFTERGEVSDSTGTPLDSVKINFTFALYSLPGGGAPLWSESQPLTPAKGMFSAVLGSVTPIGTDVLTTTPLFLGITLGADTELTPRQQVMGQ